MKRLMQIRYGLRMVVACGFIFALVNLLNHSAHAVRIKDIADIQGVRQNQLVGYGLVVGLDGTGDSDNATFTIQSLSSLLEKMGVTVRPDDLEVENVAAVMVTSELPPFARVGSRIDVLVSSIGDAENLQGGTLLSLRDLSVPAGLPLEGNPVIVFKKIFPPSAGWSAVRWWKKKSIPILIKKSR
jgi:hypothetical protein